MINICNSENELIVYLSNEVYYHLFAKSSGNEVATNTNEIHEIVNSSIQLLLDDQLLDSRSRMIITDFLNKKSSVCATTIIQILLNFGRISFDVKRGKITIKFKQYSAEMYN